WSTDAVVQEDAHHAADCGRGRLGRRLDRRQGAVVELPEGFPRRVAAFACDLDRTLIAPDLELRPRTRAAIAHVRAAGTHVIVVTRGRCESVRLCLEAARLVARGALRERWSCGA